MTNLSKNVLIIVVPILMAIGSLLISGSMMNGFEDCSHIDRLSHTIPPLPRPDNCANDQTLLARDVFSFLAFGLFIIPIATAAIVNWRKTQSETVGIDSINISG